MTRGEQQHQDMLSALNRAGAVLRTLDHALFRALEGNLDHVLDLDRARDLDEYLNCTLSESFVLALVIARNQIDLVDLARALDARAVAHAGAVARDLANALDDARNEARDAYDLAEPIDLDTAIDEARDLACDLADALVVVQDLVGSGTSSEPDQVWRPAGRWSVLMAGWAVRLLPPGDRQHYRELYGSELAELAQGRQARRAQAAYVVRVVLRTLALRRVLRAPAPAIRQRNWRARDDRGPRQSPPPVPVEDIPRHDLAKSCRPCPSRAWDPARRVDRAGHGPVDRRAQRRTVGLRGSPAGASRSAGYHRGSPALAAPVDARPRRQVDR
jgi:hypothetical protein